MLKHPLKEIVTIFSVIVTADQEGEISVESLQLEFSTIKGTTENFSPANKLGEGEFGVVYNVTCLCIMPHW